MFDFRQNLVSTEVLKSIAELKKRLSKLSESQFTSFHQDVMLLAKLICTTKKQLKPIEDVSPPIDIIVNIVDSDGRVIHTTEMKDKEIKQKENKEFRSSILSFLNQAEKFYKTKLKIGMKRDNSILAKIISIQKDVKQIKKILEKA